MNKVYFSLVVIVTIMALILSCTTSEESTSTSNNENSDLSSCGQTVLSKSSFAYRNCFSGKSTLSLE